MLTVAETIKQDITTATQNTDATVERDWIVAAFCDVYKYKVPNPTTTREEFFVEMILKFISEVVLQYEVNRGTKAMLGTAKKLVLDKLNAEPEPEPEPVPSGKQWT